jgi:hypothetical protein
MKCLPNLILHFPFSNKFHLSIFLETFKLTFLHEFAKGWKMVAQRSTNGIRMGLELNPTYWVLIKGENCLLSQELVKPFLLGSSLYHVRPCRHTSVLRTTQRPAWHWWASPDFKHPLSSSWQTPVVVMLETWWQSTVPASKEVQGSLLLTNFVA